MEILDPSITPDLGTTFKLPWAYQESRVRHELRSPRIEMAYVESFVEEIKEALPTAILFLKKLERIDLLRNGTLVSRITRIIDGQSVLVDCDGECQVWRIFEGDFSVEGTSLKDKFGSIIEDTRSSVVKIAIPDAVGAGGLLFATLPTEQSTGLPLHVDADFFPASDRKSIAFEDFTDPRSEWNRAALREAAAIVHENIIAIRDSFGKDAGSFWGLLARLYALHREHENNDLVPLKVFWEALIPSLGNSPIVHSESNKWLKPNEVRIPVTDNEKKGVIAFKLVGLETVHQLLWPYQNVLISNGVGVKRLSPEDINGALKKMGLIGNPQPIPSAFQRLESLESLWQGILGVLESTPQSARSRAEILFHQLALAPGIDGQLWPCSQAYKADAKTRTLFGNFLPCKASFLAKEEIPLLRRLCPQFTPTEAISVLNSISREDLEGSWRKGEFLPAEFIRWFDDNKSRLTDETRAILAETPMFPSAKGLHPLEDLWFPGGFHDPMGVAGLLDMSSMEGFTDFLKWLGLRELTFEEYAIRYIPEAFAAGNNITPDIKRGHLMNLDKRIGEIRNSRQLRTKLAAMNIIECQDGEFRRPNRVYFPSEAVSKVLGRRAIFAKLPDDPTGLEDLYQWLGVVSHPRLADILQIIDEEVTRPPKGEAKTGIVRMLEALSDGWESFTGDEKENVVNELRAKAWLPAEGDDRNWYKGQQLYAGYNKSLFESQAKFLDIPLVTQQQGNHLLSLLRVNLSPNPSQVVSHLQKCVDSNREPPRGVYRWLNDNATSVQLGPLKNGACFWVGNRYLSASRVFWGSHSFGRFRVQLGADLRSCQNLLQSLEVRESPAPMDALEVLTDVSKEIGTQRLQPDELSVVLQCWVILSEALSNDDISAGDIEKELRDIPSVPNNEDLLLRPTWMFFEGRPGLAEKFPDQLRGNCIPRKERVWPGMEAAGVRSLSSVIEGHIHKAINPIDAVAIRERITQRGDLIETILEGSAHLRKLDEAFVPIGELTFLQVDQLEVAWKLEALGHNWPQTPPAPAQAHLDSASKSIYFTPLIGGRYPWTSIARELSFAVAPDEAIGSVSPGLRTILEADTPIEARAEAQELGIAPMVTLGSLDSWGDTAQLFDDNPKMCDSSIGSDPTDGGVVQLGSGDDSDSSAVQLQSEAGDIPFAKRLYDVQTIDTSQSAQRQIWRPVGGPRTEESANRDTESSVQIGRSGSIVSRTTSGWEPMEAANELAARFRNMVHGDYGNRCQICSRSFSMPNGGYQSYVVHVVQPSTDHRTNHLGDLLGLCGWHYALVRYGEWALLDPDTNLPFEDSFEARGWEKMVAAVGEAPEKVDESGNPYISLPIRFWNIYQDWDPVPETISEEVRYSIPHWKYLCELLKV